MPKQESPTGNARKPYRLRKITKFYDEEDKRLYESFENEGWIPIPPEENRERLEQIRIAAKNHNKKYKKT